MNTIKEVLMRRDGLNEDEATVRIQEAKDLMNEYVAKGDFDAAENICAEEFGLEPDYLLELLW